MNAFDQQWHTAFILSHTDITIDDIWSRYVPLGGTADAVALTAYLQGTLLLSALQQDLVSYAVQEALISDHACPPDTPCPLTDSAGYQPTPPSEDAPSQSWERSLPGEDRAGPASNASSTPTGATLVAHVRHPVPDPEIRWPRLRVRLASMFDPGKAEQRRLEALQHTGLIRAGQEERFDRFTREAKARFGVTSAAITLITDTEQVVKSATGPLAGNLPRDISFCTHTITEDRAMIVTDATTEDLFRQNPLVVGAPYLRFYAGYPLTGPGGWRIGSLCLLDTEPRAFDENDRMSLIDLAHRVEAEILDG